MKFVDLKTQDKLIKKNIIKKINKIISTNDFINGQFNKTVEKKFSEKMGRKYGIAVTNGSAAIDVAVDALGIGPGDEVILPTFTIISCILQILRSGAKPVLVDSDALTWNMDVSQIENKIRNKKQLLDLKWPIFAEQGWTKTHER